MSLLDEALNTFIVSGAIRYSLLTVSALIIPALKIMNIRLSSILVALGCVFLASCYPYNENQGKRKNMKQAENMPEKTTAEAEQLKLQEQRKMKEKAAAKKREMADAGTPELPTTSPEPSETTAPPIKEKRTDYAVATKVPGQEGFVLSPYNNKKVDVRDIASGTLVQDPTYTGEGKGYFRVP
jgi:hypothetical protein